MGEYSDSRRRSPGGVITSQTTLCRNFGGKEGGGAYFRRGRISETLRYVCMYVCMYVYMSILVTLILGTLTAAVPGCSIEVQYSSIQEAMQWSVHAVHTTAAILMQISLPTLGKPNSCCIFIYYLQVKHSRS